MTIRKLVVIDLTSANIELFESYERKVIPLLRKYNANIELCVRSTDGTTETHALCFPDAKSFERFLADPVRAALRDDYELTGVTASISDICKMNYL